MTEKNVPWKVWATVTLTVSVLSSPVLVKVLDLRAETPPAASDPRPIPASSLSQTTSRRELTPADLAGMTRWQLDVLRNEIYARHGRRFRRPELQRYFEGQPWYTARYGPDDFPEETLSPVERYNVELIASYRARD